MGRRKRTSKTLEEVLARINGLTVVDSNLDFGGDLSLAKFKLAAQAFSSDLDNYNRMLADLDQQANELNASEKVLRDLSERMLAGVAARWGKDSSQYEQAGGTRKSERKRPTSKTPAATNQT
jgi:hypothetical protein